ncbi:MAG: FAD binding domain-containing protein [Chloroflexi bacterium]|nr:FAD binding domain-containing protein [Chloroflexota bacterium]
MLLNLKTIHEPATLEEAAVLLRQPDTYPIYGGAALLRHPRAEVIAGVDLKNLQLDYVRDSSDSLRLGTMLTMEQVRQACEERADQHPRLGAFAAIIKDDMTETLRHTLRFGDVLVERHPQSLILTALLALGAVLKRVDVDVHFTIAAWLASGPEIERYLIAHARFARGPQKAALVYEKVARTPADAPIVAAVVSAERREGSAAPHTTLALCGVAPTPIPQPEVARTLDETGDINAALSKLALDPPDDHWGSREYRIEMARVVARRALVKALEQLQ